METFLLWCWKFSYAFTGGYLGAWLFFKMRRMERELDEKIALLERQKVFDEGAMAMLDKFPSFAAQYTNTALTTGREAMAAMRRGMDPEVAVEEALARRRIPIPRIEDLPGRPGGAA